MKKIIAVLLVFCLTVLFGCSCFGVYANENSTSAFEVVQEEDEGVVTTRINNIQNRISTYARSNVSDPLSDFAEEHPYGFDLALAQSSNYVVYQEQIITPTSDTWNDSEGVYEDCYNSVSSGICT